MLDSQTQETLTRIGPGTPMGRLMRHYWLPVLASCDLGSGSARAVTVLCEKLVVFRDTKGALGVLEERCPHRGASLAYGCVEAEGIRCAYHGWKFDGKGRCMELPPEPADSPIRGKVLTTAYAIQELAGLIFIYLGPEPTPLLPKYDVFAWKGVVRDIGYAVLPCNWLQIMENSVDPAHVEWLHGHQLAHTRGQQGLSTPSYYRKKQVKMGFDLFDYGIIKRRLFEGGSEQDDDWAIGHPLIFPNMVRVGAHNQHRLQIRVPVDDVHTLHFWYSCYVPRPGEEVPQDVIPSYPVPWKDEQGGFLIDFVDGQDIMCWVTQGPIADRTRETLGTSDRGIALYRRLLLEQLAKVEKGEDPMGVIRDPKKNVVIELPQEKEKFGQGKSFLAESLEMSHVRHSPIKELIKRIL